MFITPSFKKSLIVEQFQGNYLNLKPETGFLLKKMPDIFVKTGHGITDMIIDCTKFQISACIKSWFKFSHVF